MHHTIDIRNLRFAYPDGVLALNGIDLYIAPGEKVALVGPNGAGKSTLMLHMNGILHGDGEIFVCGTRVSESTLAEVRAAVGLVFQDPDDQLFSQTVFEDVAFGPLYMGLPESEVQGRVRQALAAVGMQGSEGRVPHHLSVGEKKRVAIATVLSMEPEILALDEPTSGLDPRSRRGLVHLLKDLPQTMLISTHDMRLVAELSSRTILIDAGVIVADGATRAILSEAELLMAHGLESA
ncbi:MAG: cobalt ABC transporter ATP-binding protein [Chloroflexi bacterium RBG_19FT_COMBO_62_14]|nr:MAG: cobalt ABC transporter ATP-binding protein [Chloroflexi bacterium RBG_19FT_COMBO_62_14]